MRAFARRTLGFLPLLPLLLIFCLSAYKDANAKPCGNCPEYYCEDPALANKLKAQKKRQAEAGGLPPRLSALFDQLSPCEGCVKTAPDWPHISWTVDPDGYEKKYGHQANYTSISRPWSADTEMRLRQDLRDGVIKNFHIYLGQDKCKCCPRGATKDEYETWHEAGNRSTEEDPTWNEDKDFTDDAPQHNFTDKDQLGNDPKDLTELPPSQQRPQSLRDPGVHEAPAARYVHVVCRECEPLETAYNDAAKKINELRRPIAQLKRSLSFASQAVSNVETEMARTSRLAQSPEVQKKQDELMSELGDRLSDYHKTRDELLQKQAEDKALREELASVLKQIQECEKEKCKKAAADEPKTAVKAGNDAKVEDKPAAQTDGSGGTRLPGVTEGANGTLTVSSDVPRIKGGAYENGNIDYTFKAVTSSCVPCAPLVHSYNNSLYGLDAVLRDKASLPGRKQKAIEDATKAIQAEEAKNTNATPESTAAKIMGKIDDIEHNFANEEAAVNAIIAHDTAYIKLLAQAIVDCEKEHCGGQGGSGIIIGDGFDAGPGAKTARIIAFPFTWNGPYNTACFPCEKLAAELNKTYDLTRDTIGMIHSIMGYLARQEALLEALEKNGTREGASMHRDIAKQREIVSGARADIAKHEAKLSIIGEHFNKVLAMLRDCEKKYCSATDGQRAVRVGGDVKVELEQSIKVNGTDPFNVRDVEDAGVNNADGQAVTPPAPPVVTPPVTTPPVTTPPTTTPPTTPTDPTPPAATPFAASVSGSFSFAHTVGSSSCPQAAGTATVTSNNGHVLSVTNISVSGSIQPKLTVSAGANGTSVTVTAQFNCSSPANGTFTGTVTATVTDTVTGETQTISISASGSVSG
ncbi:MAG: hypothetical protein J0L97_05380 [Alphaproteobacteria bacterium]|nr:hypothetical protein [Alphaproteobacteria bacterium]